MVKHNIYYQKRCQTRMTTNNRKANNQSNKATNNKTKIQSCSIINHMINDDNYHTNIKKWKNCWCQNQHTFVQTLKKSTKTKTKTKLTYILGQTKKYNKIQLCTLDQNFKHSCIIN